MNCINFRQKVLSDPQDLEPQEALHLESCRDCARYYKEIVELDNALMHITAGDVPEDLASRIKLQQAIASENRLRSAWTRQFALAASIILAVTLIFTAGWNNYTENRDAESFRIAASRYIDGNPGLLTIEEDIDKSRLSRFVMAFGGDLVSDIDGVQFAEACAFEGFSAAHMIIDGQTGPVTVMYSPAIDLDREFAFESSRFSALHIPADRGSVAIYGNQDEPLREMIDKLGDSISW